MYGHWYTPEREWALTNERGIGARKSDKRCLSFVNFRSGRTQTEGAVVDWGARRDGSYRNFRGRN